MKVRRTNVQSFFSWMTLASGVALLAIGSASQAFGQYSYVNIGKPEGAYNAVAVRMNNLGHVAGWSQYFGQGEPSLRGWVWTPEDGFTILPPPPGFPNGRSRAMDINDSGGVAGDGGFDTGLAWRYENGVYTVTGGIENMPVAYLGGINDAGDVVGTATDGSLTTPDYAFLDVDGELLLSITPGGGRATDVNNAGQVCGYLNSPLEPFQAYRWDAIGGVQPLGSLGLAFSFANRMNDAGDVVGYARSASGNTNRAWIYTDAGGMVQIPGVPANVSQAISINNSGHVVGLSTQSGPDFNWLWTGGATVTPIASLIDIAEAYVNVLEVRDINNAGQILVEVYDNNVPDYRNLILTPPGAGVPGDIDGDGDVDEVDQLLFVAVLIGDDLDAGHVARSDLTGDGGADGGDVQMFVDARLGN